MSRSASVILRAQWQQRLERFRESLWTVGEFCRHEGVSVASFYQWRRKLGGASIRREPKRPSATVPTFLPVQVTSTASVQITFPNGTRLTLPAHDHELVKLSLTTLAVTPTATGGT